MYSSLLEFIAEHFNTIVFLYLLFTWGCLNVSLTFEGWFFWILTFWLSFKKKFLALCIHHPTASWPPIHLVRNLLIILLKKFTFQLFYFSAPEFHFGLFVCFLSSYWYLYFVYILPFSHFPCLPLAVWICIKLFKNLCLVDLPPDYFRNSYYGPFVGTVIEGLLFIYVWIGHNSLSHFMPFYLLSIIIHLNVVLW